MRLVSNDSRLENDHAILRHELAHALVWFTYGGAIGRLKVCRLENDGLLASTRFGPMCRNVSSLEADEASAVRLLAGEVAARRFLKLPDSQVSCEVPFHPATTTTEVLYHLTEARADIAKALQFACQYAGNSWFTWLEKRHTEARRIVDGGWNAIDAGARKLERYIPSEPGSSFSLPGLWLIKRFEDGSITTNAKNPIEAVHEQVLGDCGMRLCRFLRLRITKSLSIFEDRGD